MASPLGFDRTAALIGTECPFPVDTKHCFRADSILGLPLRSAVQIAYRDDTNSPNDHISPGLQEQYHLPTLPFTRLSV